jgi:ubiquinone/menaquinone biosynthesis C-methylase UbiE
VKQKLINLLLPYSTDSNGIYECMPDSCLSDDQRIEIELRERVADKIYDNYLSAISHSHSIPVMDYEIEKFLKTIPQDGLILDIGGCWGWHWRRLAITRPDVNVIIIDFIRSNLVHAKNVLIDLVGNQVALMHADATTLPFKTDVDFSGFDGIWTVQTFQHIPDFKKAISEAHRVLKRKAVFANYSINSQPHIRMLYRLFGKDYISKGLVDQMYWLARASKEQKKIVEEIFSGIVTERWSEILYSPELHCRAAGRESSKLGKLDAVMSNNFGFLGWLARQNSFHIKKK